MQILLYLASQPAEGIFFYETSKKHIVKPYSSHTIHLACSHNVYPLLILIATVYPISSI